jgi:hypothetical protein
MANPIQHQDLEIVVSLRMDSCWQFALGIPTIEDVRNTSTRKALLVIYNTALPVPNFVKRLETLGIVIVAPIARQAPRPPGHPLSTLFYETNDPLIPMSHDNGEWQSLMMHVRRHAAALDGIICVGFCQQLHNMPLVTEFLKRWRSKLQGTDKSISMTLEMHRSGPREGWTNVLSRYLLGIRAAGLSHTMTNGMDEMDSDKIDAHAANQRRRQFLALLNRRDVAQELQNTTGPEYMAERLYLIMRANALQTRGGSRSLWFDSNDRLFATFEEATYMDRLCQQAEYNGYSHCGSQTWVTK